MRLTKALAAALALVPVGAPAQDAGHDFVLAHLGRFAVFADRSSIERTDGTVAMRALQVADAGFRVGDQAYWGGWSYWRFDCAARTADRLDFAAIKEGGEEAAPFPDDAPAYDAAPGGEAAELLDIACTEVWHTASDARSLEVAVRKGRAVLAD
jgi:hypothetical protein